MSTEHTGRGDGAATNVPCVLLYHEVSTRSVSLINRFGITLHPRVLEAHLTAVVRHFKPIGLEELFDAWARGESVRDRVLITFDDGYRDAVCHAAPLLAKLALPSVWFVNSDMWHNDRVFWLSTMMWIEEHGLMARFVAVANRRWPGILSPYPGPERVNGWAKIGYSRTLADYVTEFATEYGWDEAAAAGEAHLFASPGELRQLADLAAVGNHTATHPNCRNLTLPALWGEVSRCDAAIRRDVGVTPRAFAFPFGEPGYHWSPVALPTLAPLGYRALFSVDNDERLVSSGRWTGAVPRDTVPLGPVTASEFSAYLSDLMSRC